MKYLILIIAVITLFSSCKDEKWYNSKGPTTIHVTFTNQEGIPINEQDMKGFSFNGNTYPNRNFSLVALEDYHILSFYADWEKLNRTADFRMPVLNYEGSFFIGENDRQIYLQFEEQIIYPDENVPYGSFVIPLPL